MTFRNCFKGVFGGHAGSSGVPHDRKALLRGPTQSSSERSASRSSWWRTGSRLPNTWSDRRDLVLVGITIVGLLITPLVLFRGWSAFPIFVAYLATAVLRREVVAWLPGFLLLASGVFAPAIAMTLGSAESAPTVHGVGVMFGICGFLGRLVAVSSRKNHATLLGLSFGPIGVLVGALLPPALANDD